MSIGPDKYENPLAAHDATTHAPKAFWQHLRRYRLTVRKSNVIDKGWKNKIIAFADLDNGVGDILRSTPCGRRLSKWE